MGFYFLKPHMGRKEFFMEIGYFGYEVPQEDWINDGFPQVYCVWDNVPDVIVKTNAVGHLVAQIPVPIDFTEQELLNHVYLAQERHLLLFEEEYLDLVQAKFQVEIRRTEYPSEKPLRISEKIAIWLRPLTLVAA